MGNWYAQYKLCLLTAHRRQCNSVVEWSCRQRCMVYSTQRSRDGYPYSSQGRYGKSMLDGYLRDIGLKVWRSLYDRQCRLTVPGLDIHDFIEGVV